MEGSICHCKVTDAPSHLQVRNAINPLPADHDYVRFYSSLLVDQITVIGHEMCV